MRDQEIEHLVRDSLHRTFAVPQGPFALVRATRPKARWWLPLAAAAVSAVTVTVIYSARDIGQPGGEAAPVAGATSADLGKCFTRGSEIVNSYDGLPIAEAAARAQEDGFQLRGVAVDGQCTMRITVALSNPIEVEIDADGRVVQAARPPARGN